MSRATDRRGSIVYATQGDRTSWNIDQTTTGGDGGPPQRIRAFVLERSSETVVCYLESQWRCLVGGSDAGQTTVFFDRKSFAYLALAARVVPLEEYKRFGKEIAGRQADCFEVVPQYRLFEGGTEKAEVEDGYEDVPPLVEIEGIDKSTLDSVRASVVAEVLWYGGRLCMGGGALLEVAVLGPGLFQMSAVTIGQPSERDFELPAPAEPVEAPSPYPSVIRMP